MSPEKDVMNEHHRRITRRIFEEIVKCKIGERSLTDLETSIEGHLRSLDETYPRDLKAKLNQCVKTILQVQLQFLDEPNEDAEVEKAFDTLIGQIQGYLA